MSPEIDHLLARYFSGEATGEDLKNLDRWLAESAENEAYFDRMTQIFEKSAMEKPIEVDTEKAFQWFDRYMDIFSDTDIVPDQTLHIVNKSENEPGYDEFIPEQTGPDKESRQKKPVIRFLRPASYAAAAVVMLMIGLLYTINSQKDNSTIVTVASVDSLLHQLPDKTLVTLDSNSNVRYDTQGDHYEIILAGKARFEVNPESDKKLLVRADEIFIEDIGTIFTVTAYPDRDTTFVDVEEGEVRFYSTTNEGIHIRANEKGIYIRSEKRFEKISPRVIQELNFRAVSLNDVVSIISEHTGVSIVLTDDSLGTLPITTSFEGNESVADMLLIIAETLSLKLSHNNNQYILSR